MSYKTLFVLSFIALSICVFILDLSYNYKYYGFESVDQLSVMSNVFLTIVGVMSICVIYKQYINEHRPYVYFNIEIKDRFIYASLENFGKRPAYNILIKTNPEIKRVSCGIKYELGKTSCLIKKNISFLPPNKKLCDLINSGPSFYKNDVINYDIKITYKDYFGKTYKEEYNLNLESFKSQIGLQSDPIKVDLTEESKKKMLRILCSEWQIGDLRFK